MCLSKVLAAAHPAVAISRILNVRLRIIVFALVLFSMFLC